MVAVTLDGKARSLELPPECLSVAQAASFAKRQLGPPGPTRARHRPCSRLCAALNMGPCRT